VLLIVALVIAGFTLLLWIRDKRLGSKEATDGFDRTEQATRSASATSPSTPPSISPARETSPPVQSPAAANTESPASPANTVTPNDLGPTTGVAFSPGLVIPVVGVRSDQLLDTFADARSEGRVHDAIDIPAPAGTPVVATANGEIIKLFQSDRGGTTIYQLSVDKKWVFYYAHLQRYADGLAAGKFVKQGEVIGYVGDTGNAGAGNFHLHFSIAIISDPKRYWEGTNINPYPLLRK
jgi:murein DD-endopeptidase MepM/ murein hydrolase activator NlpD